MVNEFTMLVKASSILSVIAVVELTRTAQNIMNVTYRPVEAFCIAAVLYFIMLFSCSLSDPAPGTARRKARAHDASISPSSADNWQILAKGFGNTSADLRRVAAARLRARLLPWRFVRLRAGRLPAAIVSASMSRSSATSRS